VVLGLSRQTVGPGSTHVWSFCSILLFFEIECGARSYQCCKAVDFSSSAITQSIITQSKQDLYIYVFYPLKYILTNFQLSVLTEKKVLENIR
jgi:hypothetical protein